MSRTSEIDDAIGIVVQLATPIEKVQAVKALLKALEEEGVIGEPGTPTDFMLAETRDHLGSMEFLLRHRATADYVLAGE